MSDRIIFHIDVNSAFLSWTALDYLAHGEKTDLRLIPCIIGGDQSKRHGVVLAKSIPAKNYGIITGEPVVDAVRKCPNLLLVPPNHSLYNEMSGKLMHYLYQICPEIEQASIDECYMDYTPISKNYASPLECATFIKDTVFEKFGFTVNIGISNRKVLAKMASDFQKPNRIHTLYSGEIQQKIWDMPVSSLFMCGRSSVEILRNLEILTIGDLAKANPKIIQAHLKSSGLTLWRYANGEDTSKVIAEPVKAKGIGNSTTLTEDARTKEDVYPVLLSLCESVGKRLRTSGERATVICTEIKYATFESVSHQTTIMSPTASTDMIYQTACDLFNALWDGTPIRLLGVRTTKLVPDSEPVQLSLFDIDIKQPQKALQSERQQSLDTAIDSIRQKYGQNAIIRGTLLPPQKDK